MPLRQLNFETEYRSAQSELAATFYRRTLEQSIRYDRAAGYFSSTVFLVVGAKFIDFARRGGKIRLICSPQLSEADINALKDGHATLADISAIRLMEELEQVLAIRSIDFPVKALSTLVAIGALEIRIAVRASGYGIFHEKLGIFEDENADAVTFIGSANETWNGWHAEGNYEAIEVFCSWTGDQARTTKHRSHFANIWARKDPSLLVIDFPDAVRQKLCSVAVKSLDDLRPPDQAPSQARPTPRDHQAAAIDAWCANSYRGIFKHATGSGKTLTAIFALEKHLGEGGVGIILVPSTLLLLQWESEVRQYFPRPDVLLVGGGNDAWRTPGTLRSFTSSDKLLGGRLVIATIQTARSEPFLARLRQGSHLMLVADEVHQLGSDENSKVLSISAAKRLGLSATPERFGDPAGTARIMNYFSGIIPPEYTLNDAINDHNLVPYEYHPDVVSLSDSEIEAWNRLSREISIAIGKDKTGLDSSTRSDQIKLLMIRRARIAKKASGKEIAAQRLLRQHYRSGQRWLVYCEDGDQLRNVLRQTREWASEVMEYHSAMAGDSKATLKWFQDQGGILIAIACLDEGVNIPSISHALILASSQNPRQFIQRRGRILRRFPGKRVAVIHDVLVAPENVDDEPTQRSLMRSELRRAVEFADTSVNPSAKSALRIIAARAGIDPDTVDDVGTEEIDQPEG